MTIILKQPSICPSIFRHRQFRHMRLIRIRKEKDGFIYYYYQRYIVIMISM